jgi:hypothetical protein
VASVRRVLSAVLEAVCALVPASVRCAACLHSPRGSWWAESMPPECLVGIFVLQWAHGVLT